MCAHVWARAHRNEEQVSEIPFCPVNSRFGLGLARKDLLPGRGESASLRLTSFPFGQAGLGVVHVERLRGHLPIPCASVSPSASSTVLFEEDRKVPHLLPGHGEWHYCNLLESGWRIPFAA